MFGIDPIEALKIYSWGLPNQVREVYDKHEPVRPLYCFTAIAELLSGHDLVFTQETSLPLAFVGGFFMLDFISRTTDELGSLNIRRMGRESGIIGNIREYLLERG